MSAETVPRDFSVKLATWCISYDKSCGDFENRCWHFSKWSLGAQIIDFLKIQPFFCKNRHKDFILRSASIDFRNPRTFSHKKYLKSQTLPKNRASKSRTTGGPKRQNCRKYVQICKNDENLHLKWNYSPSLARAPMPVHLSKPFGTPLHVGL